MIGCKKTVLNERSDKIPISKNIYTLSKNKKQENVAYDLNQNCFDPTKSSPPNNFMEKLMQRLSVYNSLSINVANLDNA
jgi:hypothetical protein